MLRKEHRFETIFFYQIKNFKNLSERRNQCMRGKSQNTKSQPEDFSWLNSILAPKGAKNQSSHGSKDEYVYNLN